MTVSELIAVLEKLPAGADVYIQRYNDDDSYLIPLDDAYETDTQANTVILSTID